MKYLNIDLTLYKEEYKMTIALSINKLQKLTNKWFSYSLTEVQAKEIIKVVNKMCEEYA